MSQRHSVSLTEEFTWEGTEASCQRPAPGERAIWQVGPSVVVEPHDRSSGQCLDCSLMRDPWIELPRPATPTLLTHRNSQKMFIIVLSYNVVAIIYNAKIDN